MSQDLGPDQELPASGRVEVDCKGQQHREAAGQLHRRQSSAIGDVRASMDDYAARRRRSALDTTVMLEADIASAPNSGRSIRPKGGYRTPAAIGIAIML